MGTGIAIWIDGFQTCLHHFYHWTISLEKCLPVQEIEHGSALYHVLNTYHIAMMQTWNQRCVALDGLAKASSFEVPCLCPRGCLTSLTFNIFFPSFKDYSMCQSTRWEKLSFIFDQPLHFPIIYRSYEKISFLKKLWNITIYF
jgi:hypothetical protein